MQGTWFPTWGRLHAQCKRQLVIWILKPPPLHNSSSCSSRVMLRVQMQLPVPVLLSRKALAHRCPTPPPPTQPSTSRRSALGAAATLAFPLQQPLGLRQGTRAAYLHSSSSGQPLSSSSSSSSSRRYSLVCSLACNPACSLLRFCPRLTSARCLPMWSGWTTRTIPVGTHPA